MGEMTLDQQKALARARARMRIAQEKPAEEQKTDRSWSDVPMEALGNIPSSAANFASGVGQAVMHPIDTGMNLWDAAAGGLRNALPSSLVNMVEGGNPNPSAIRASNTANVVGDFYKDRYGSEEGVKNTLATDPVGAASDLSVLLTGGAAATAKLPKISSALKTAGRMVDPVAMSAKATKAIAMPTSRGAANLIGNLGTHTGGESLKQAVRSGYEGGKSGETFVSNMRGKVPYDEVLQATKDNLATMGRAKSAEYRAGMAAVSGDKAVLSFDGINKSIADSVGVVTFKGKVKNTKAANVLKDIGKEVDNWQKLDPAVYHTPEGLDALKQKIGGIVESVPFEEKTARMVANKIYHSIKNEITNQAPVYADVMRDYSTATDQIREIERAFSLGNKASVDTAMRKLQSLTRNNVNTNYGNRLDLMKQLEQQGGKEVMPGLAGQALSTWTPRGLGSAVAGGLGLGGYAVGGAPLALPTLAVQSPRLMGESAYKIGQGARMAEKPINALGNAGIDPSLLANILYQSGRLPQ